jgi:GNAT superfamily N-acetyltransferase
MQTNVMAKVERKVERARTLIAQRQYAELLDVVSYRVMPAGNPVLYWDKFSIFELIEPRPIRRAPAQRPELATAADIDELCARFPDRAELFRRRVQDGQRCLVVREDGRITGRIWMMVDRPSYPTNAGMIFMPPAQPSVWCHDIFVDPMYRMRGHFVSFMQEALRQTVVRPRLYGEIHFLNRASIRAHESFGFRAIRDVTVVSALGLKVYHQKDPDGQRSWDYRYALRVPHN